MYIHIVMNNTTAVAVYLYINNNLAFKGTAEENYYYYNDKKKKKKREKEDYRYLNESQGAKIVGYLLWRWKLLLILFATRNENT